jgi:hypothetical protein
MFRLALALALGAATAAHAQTAPDKAAADAKKPAAAAKAAPKAATPAVAAKDALRGTAPAVTGTSKAVAPQPLRALSPGKEGGSSCHSMESDA